MSQEFMDPEILADFFVEAKEHLETIEPNLLELEKNPTNLGLLNEIFRPMHSLKGASGFLGLNKINSLAHKAENILDELRQGGMAVTAEIMDIILAATDALRSMVESLETKGNEGDVDIVPIIARIEAALEGGAAPAGGAEVGEEPEAEPELEPESASVPEDVVGQANGRRPVIQVEADPDFDATPYALTIVGEGHLADFLEEAGEIIANLNQSLLDLESESGDRSGLVNDTFRYFHNLKGNSGIIGFRELNALTHEAETLLNRARKGEMAVSQGLVDLLLAAVDAIEAMVGKVDAKTGQVVPSDISGLVALLRQATESGEVAAPSRVEAAASAGEPEPAAEAEAESEVEAKPEPDVAAPEVEPSVSTYDPEDVAVFESTVLQQIENVNLAMEALRKDDSQTEYVDGLYRSLVTFQNSSGYMGLGELRDYAERTAKLVDQGRKSGIGFGMMLDILEQEFAILRDMVLKELESIKAGQAAASADTPAPETQKPEPKVEPAPVDAPVVSTPAPKPTPKPVPPASKPTAKPVPKPAPRPDPGPPLPDNGRGAPAEAGKQKVSTTIRVDHQKLDHLMNLIGELIINRNRYSMLARALEEGQQEVHMVAQQLTETTYAMARISDDLQDTIMKVRMVPVQTVFSRFPRLVRDLSRKSAKEVELILEGEETELDKSVVEEIGDPLVHLVRNAVDHGLESEQDRTDAGKKATGHVWLRAYHKGNSVAIEVEDDGRGIDPEKMRKVAVKKGLMSQEEAQALGDREAIELIFAPGFSSADKVTDISGRGVGMDVVKTNIKNLKGSVQTHSEVGKGTRITLTLPLTLAIIDALMVQVNGHTYAIPLDAVSETTKIETERLADVNKRKAVTLRGEVLGIVELSELLNLPANEENREILPVVVIHDNDRRLGIVVDRLLERQEIVIKPLGHYLNTFDIKGISGATIMGDGSVVLILDPHEVYALSTQLAR
ncbi:Hpt domain-containing protein [Desulfovibrio aminophilus]|uniref:chemotaxis protein CheA n=1 Tax=Desulfovibrio aminophilus TaxID=81425 RepID=UPI0033961AA5